MNLPQFYSKKSNTEVVKRSFTLTELGDEFIREHKYRNELTRDKVRKLNTSHSLAGFELSVFTVLSYSKSL